MTFLEGIADVAGLTRSDLASLVSQGLRSGLSGNRMLSEAQSLGVGIRRADFLGLVGEVRSAIANESAISALSMTAVAEEALVTQWTGGATNTYLHRVSMFVREGVPGDKSVVRHDFDILSDHILTKAEAQQRAEDIFINGQVDDKYPDQELLGSELRNIYHQQGNG